MTVSSTVENNKAVPFIRLRGNWLKQAGFEIGDSYKVDVSQNRLVLTNNVPEQSIDDMALIKNGSGIENIVEDAFPVFRNKASKYEKGYHGYTVNLKLVRSKYFEPVHLNNPNEAYNFLKSMQDETREIMLSINLDSKNTVNGVYEVAKGGIAATSVYLTEVLKSALLQNSTAILLAHNHPSGDPTPSLEDISLTANIDNVAKLIGISLHDHIIIGYNRYVSMKESGHFKK